jgi:hypothetical protein
MVVDTVETAPHNRRLVSALKIYRVVLAISVIANLAVGVFIFGWPDHFASLLGQPEAFPDTWPRHWGMQLWAINLLYLPGLLSPEQQRWPNWMGIAIRLTFSAFFFSQGDGFTPMGIYDGVSGLLLLITFLPVTRATKL